MPANRPIRIKIRIIIIIILPASVSDLNNNQDNGVAEILSNRLAKVMVMYDEHTDQQIAQTEELSDVNTAFEALAEFLDGNEDPNQTQLAELSDDLGTVIENAGI